jgi:hypothetical protein
MHILSLYYLLVIKIDNTQNSIRVRFLIIHFDSCTHLVFFNHNICKVTELKQLGVWSKQLCKEFFKGLEVDLVRIIEIKINIDNVL